MTIKDFVRQGLYPNEGGLRAIIFYHTGNFCKKVIRRINRRVFINVQSYYNWVDEQNGRQAQA
jgi:hypothetical protein